MLEYMTAVNSRMLEYMIACVSLYVRIHDSLLESVLEYMIAFDSQYVEIYDSLC